MVDIASSPTVPTNTITITNLENHHFEPTLLLALRTQTEAFGQVCYFSPIKSFHRVFVVYHSVFDAQKAKAFLHSTRFEDTTLRVYFGQHTELSIDPEKYYLHLPEHVQVSTEKTGLISPPGSPPVCHIEDDDMDTIENLSLDDITPSPTPSTFSPTLIPSETTQYQHILKLRIDTLCTPSSSSSIK
ncbi:hypothetical protein BGZ54_008852 [Gamsiella multidivaricata]|nr:hypothetical protein BGZ54_008852 [Gamsiella multidivaricata]